MHLVTKTSDRATLHNCLHSCTQTMKKGRLLFSGYTMYM